MVPVFGRNRCSAWVSKLSVGSGMVASCRVGGKSATKVKTPGSRQQKTLVSDPSLAVDR